MLNRTLMAALALAAAAAGAPAGATTLPLAANGQWAGFSIDTLLSQSSGVDWIDDSGAPLRFTFSIAQGQVGSLTVVDGVVAGDRFAVTNAGSLLGTTSAVPVASYTDADFGSAVDLGYDFDAALADPSFSKGSFVLGAGSYSISGTLIQSVVFDGTDLNATAGAVRLSVASVSAVPEPSTVALMAAGLGLLGVAAKRRRA